MKKLYTILKQVSVVMESWQTAAQLSTGDELEEARAIKETTKLQTLTLRGDNLSRVNKDILAAGVNQLKSEGGRGVWRYRPPVPPSPGRGGCLSREDGQGPCQARTAQLSRMDQGPGY